MFAARTRDPAGVTGSKKLDRIESARVFVCKPSMRTWLVSPYFFDFSLSHSPRVHVVGVVVVLRRI